MKKSLFLLTLLLSILMESQAQYYTNRNKIWAFGLKAGLDFTSGSPVPTGTSLSSAVFTEGSASVCDTAGNLLFYTDGKSVYNRNHALMPSGLSIVSFITASTTQAALIVPVINDPQRYYLFSLQQVSWPPDSACRMEYCIIDMALDGGYGDVVPGTAGALVADSLAEKMIAITGNSGNIWLLTHLRDSAVFLAYEITAAGINTVPVVSPTGTFSSPGGYATGVMKASPNRRKIVSQTRQYALNSFGTKLYDFDPFTGIVANCITLDNANSQYGAEFSPDNTKLYTQQSAAPDTTKIYQYNLTLGSPVAVKASKTLIATVATEIVSDLRLAPDNKIYFIGHDDSSYINEFSRHLDRITSPNLSGTACGYLANAVALPDTAGMRAGFPNLVVTEDTLAVSVNVYGTAKVNDFAVFPNPAGNQITIAAQTNINHITITNLAGIEVHQAEYNGKAAKVNISSLPPGVYFLSVNRECVKNFIKR